MKNKDVKVGMKVVPFRKTTGWHKGLRKSVAWMQRGGVEQGYLIVTKFDHFLKAWTLSPTEHNNGDFFKAGDFKPYEPSV